MPSLTKLLLAAGLASAATLKIDVGQGGFIFSPNELKAAVGDVLEFHFYPSNHSVVQGDFDNGCQPVTTGGFFSGFFPTSSGENSNVFSVTVNDTNPIAFYCSQGKHCQNGMVGVINPTTSSSLANYGGAVKVAKNSTSPASAFGGTIGPAPKASNTSSASSSTSDTAATSTPSATTKPSGAGSLSASLGSLAIAACLALYLV